jgi:hypothetical protein
LGAACFTGILYFAVVFTFAFAMGAARALFTAPRLGSMAAVLMEVPILVTASWIVAPSTSQSIFTLPQRALIGATAFTLTMVIEAMLSVIMGGSVTDWVIALTTPAGLVGLTGQIIFGAMPIFVGRGRPAV